MAVAVVADVAVAVVEASAGGGGVQERGSAVFRVRPASAPLVAAAVAAVDVGLAAVALPAVFVWTGGPSCQGATCRRLRCHQLSPSSWRSLQQKINTFRFVFRLSLGSEVRGR